MVDELAPHEKALLDLIAANPFAGQQELAAALGVARSTVAAQIVQLISRGHILGRGYLLPERQRVVCIGGATFNRKYHTHGQPIFGTSNPSSGHRNFGGVGRNVAENLARLGLNVSFVSAVGDDEIGRAILRQLRDLGADVSQTLVAADTATAEYAAILDPANELVIGIADMQAFDLLTPAFLDRVWPHIGSGTWVFADCNLPAETLADLFRRKAGARFKLAVDTVSVAKAIRLQQDLSAIDLLFTNRDEAQAILGITEGRLTQLEAATHLGRLGVRDVVVTNGGHGHLVVSDGKAFAVSSIAAQPVDITGAGDALIAGTIFRLLSGDPLETASRTGALLATLTIESPADVRPDLGPALLVDNAARLAQCTTSRIREK